MKAAGITRHVTPHHARHTWASWHYAVHKDMLLLRHDGGWAKTDMVERYTHLTPRGMAPEIEAFWGVPGAEVVQGDSLRREKQARSA